MYIYFVTVYVHFSDVHQIVIELKQHHYWLTEPVGEQSRKSYLPESKAINLSVLLFLKRGCVISAFSSQYLIWLTILSNDMSSCWLSAGNLGRQADCDALRDWASSYGATVRQETTMARHGTLLEFMYQRQCEISEKPVPVHCLWQAGQYGRCYQRKRLGVRRGRRVGWKQW